MLKVPSKHSYLDLFEGIIIGGSLAAVATFIFGTKKGKELQKKLVHQYKKVGRVTHDMRSKIEKAIKTHTSKGVKSAVKKVAKRVKAKFKTAKRRSSLRKAA